MDFNERLDEWVQKVKNSYAIATKGNNYSGIDTYQMMCDIDDIIAESFNHDKCLPD